MADAAKHEGLLAGTTILDLTRNVAGPYATMALRDLGARIVKIEPLTGDDTRHWPPFVDDRSAVFTGLNRGKESIALDLHSDEAREIVLALAKTSDAVLESARPGALDRVGMGREALKRANPDIVHVTLTAYGDRGPLGGQPGYDAVVQAYSGIMHMTGESDGPPVRAGAAVIDVGSAVWALVAILAGLLARERGATGPALDVTMLGTAVSLLTHHLSAASIAGAQLSRQGSRQQNSAPYETVEIGGELVMVAAPNQRLWGVFCKETGVDDLHHDERFDTVADRVANRAEMCALLKERLSGEDAADIVARLGTAGVPAARIQSPAALLEDEQARALDLLQESEDGYLLPSVPLSIDGRGGLQPGRSPGLGEHTGAILADLGYDAEAVAALVSRGVVDDGGK